MKYRGTNYEARGSKNFLTRGAFGKAKKLPVVNLKDVSARTTIKPKKPIALYRFDSKRLITSKYSPSAKAVDTTQ